MNKMEKLRLKHSQAVDDYCSSHYPTVRTRTGLVNMSKYSKKIEKLKLKNLHAQIESMKPLVNEIKVILDNLNDIRFQAKILRIVNNKTRELDENER